ncbi:MAG: hypothetical protein B6I30_09500 [Desulfobacteraceae bacterium 4572_187]|nr:MAG: hypothetical protein B6I30_09500 [Desulfobacteraceae bacterium 4572_187]
MKGRCLIAEADGGYLFTFDGKQPLEGREYLLEDTTTGTAAQNKAFHALVQEYWKSGQHSYDVPTFAKFREHIKRDLGTGYDAFVYADIDNGKPKIKHAKDYTDIPEHIRKDFDLKEMIFGRLKSWSQYTNKQRRDTLDRLIAEMMQAGVNSAKFNEIIKGMEK